MSASAIVNEGRFKAWFYAGDPALVDIGFFLLSSGMFDIQVKETLSIDNCNTQLFGLGCID